METKDGWGPGSNSGPEGNGLPKAGLLVLALLLAVFVTSATTCLAFPRREQHEFDSDNLQYSQEWVISACDAPISPKTGSCLLAKIDGMLASTRGEEFCAQGLFIREEVDWDIEDGGLNIPQVSVAGSGDVHGYCPDGHALEWYWHGEWFDDAAGPKVVDGYDFELP